MAEQNNATTADMPIFRLEKLYLKDLSFESPNTPDVFFLQEQEPKVEMNLKMTDKKIDDNHWEVCLEISATITDTKADKTLMVVEIEHAGAFLMENIPEEHIEQVLYVDCPTTLFPFTRQIVSQVSVDGGFMPFLMEPMNFAGMYQSKIKQQQEKKAN